jgi:phosphocarrier protein
MIKRQITICNKLGLHARAAARFVQIASGYDCDVRLAKNDKEVNGKSIMGVMMLAAGKGSEIQIMADGHDEERAVSRLEALVADKFGEDE